MADIYPAAGALAYLSAIGDLVVGFLVAPVHLYGPQPLKGIADFMSGYPGNTITGAAIFDFYGLPGAGDTLGAFPADLIAFTLSSDAYSAEITCCTIISVPKIQ